MSAAFDRAHFAHMTGDDVALQAEIIALFRGQVASWEGALASRAPGWRDVAHTIKGSARGIGLGKLADACEAAEKADDAAAGAALVQLKAALDEALAALPAA